MAFDICSVSILRFIVWSMCWSTNKLKADVSFRCMQDCQYLSRDSGSRSKLSLGCVKVRKWRHHLLVPIDFYTFCPRNKEQAIFDKFGLRGSWNGQIFECFGKMIPLLFRSPKITSFRRIVLFELAYISWYFILIRSWIRREKNTNCFERKVKSSYFIHVCLRVFT